MRTDGMTNPMSVARARHLTVGIVDFLFRDHSVEIHLGADFSTHLARSERALHHRNDSIAQPVFEFDAGFVLLHSDHLVVIGIGA
jgi:hypothetical protein